MWNQQIIWIASCNEIIYGLLEYDQKQIVLPHKNKLLNEIGFITRIWPMRCVHFVIYYYFLKIFHYCYIFTPMYIFLLYIIFNDLYQLLKKWLRKNREVVLWLELIRNLHHWFLLTIKRHYMLQTSVPHKPDKPKYGLLSQYTFFFFKFWCIRITWT